jgi:plasmid stability protein
MPTLTIRNVDDEVVQRLKAQAKQHGRSLEAEAREILAQAAQKPTLSEFRERARRIAAMTPKDVKQTDSVELLREDRDR